MNEYFDEIAQEMPACNEQFCESGGVYPPEHLCVFGCLSPARTFVYPRLREAALPLGEMRGRHSGSEIIV